MKLAMTLRTRLFLSFSALITVALLGLLLGVISVMHMAQAQESLIQHNFTTIDLSQKLRQGLGDQLVILLSENPDLGKLQASQAQFKAVLREGMSGRSARARAGFLRIDKAYQRFQQVVAQPASMRWTLLDGNDFSEAFNEVRKHMLDLQQQAIDSVSQAEAQARERAKLIAGLLGLLGIAVLAIGVLTAQSIARRFGAPIEVLAKAADRIGQGNFEVTLPESPVAEMALLSRRFGLMAEALRHHKATDIEELRASQRRLQAVLDSIDDGLVIIDAQGRIEHANPVATRQLFWQHDPHGQSLGEVLARPELDEATQRVLRGELLEQAPEDLPVETAGENRLLAWSLTPVCHIDGRSVGAVMVLRDVTEQRAFERVRSEFVLRASHELRTPVTGMHMAFSLLQERLSFAEGSREADLIQTVNEEMLRLVRLITDLLNFSRYQNGLQKLELAPCDLDELIGQTQQRFLAQASERGIHLQAEVQQPLPHINLDRLQIERVLDNLLANALRHSSAGGQIHLQARRHGERVIISVQDNGEGIDFSQQARIFEPFVQIGRKKGGAGLGLALCKEIVQLHGGRISVYSRPGQGSQFYMALPL
ncbi:MAG: KinB sensor domain-containing domain [Pseudomonas sp.]|uniref:KinB sensor domain-containing domain n=1 Tax=Pseudomonas sp. TaxID=306 RepID=UPI003398F579